MRPFQSSLVWTSQIPASTNLFSSVSLSVYFWRFQTLIQRHFIKRSLCYSWWYTLHEESDNNDKVSINLCQSLLWATFQIPCHSCHLCHSAKGNKNTPLVMNTGSDSDCNWAFQWPIGLTQTTTDSGYQCLNPICVTACVYIRRHRGWPMPRPIEIVTAWHFDGSHNAHLGVTFFG